MIFFLYSTMQLYNIFGVVIDKLGKSVKRYWPILFLYIHIKKNEKNIIHNSHIVLNTFERILATLKCLCCVYLF